MASRGDLLSDPRSGARPLGGGARQGRPPRDQATRDDLARTRRQASSPTSATSPAPAARSQARRPAAGPRKPRKVPGTGNDATAPIPATSDDAAAAAATVLPGTGNQPRTPPGGGRSFTTEGSGAFLALFAYPLAVNFLRGGRPRAWGWVKAKWVNEPYGAAAPASTAAGGSASLSAPHNMRRVLR